MIPVDKGPCGRCAAFSFEEAEHASRGTCHKAPPSIMGGLGLGFWPEVNARTGWCWDFVERSEGVMGIPTEQAKPQGELAEARDRDSEAAMDARVVHGGVAVR